MNKNSGITRIQARLAIVATIGCLAFMTGTGVAEAAVAPTPSVAAPPTGPAPASHAPTSDRAAADPTLWTWLANVLAVPVSWTGSIFGCQPGTNSGASDAAALTEINYIRSLNHLAPVTFNSNLSAHARSAALMMAANHTLDHNPPSSWKCWSSAGATSASQSDLAMSEPAITSGMAISLYMDDDGSSNVAVGHRRWILYPFTTTMGIGSTDTTNALTVVGPTDPGRPNPAWVSWPSAGAFPVAMEPNGRWSLSSGDSRTKFGKSVVRVYRAGQRVPIHQWPVTNHYGMPTIVWQMPTGFSTTSDYTVVVKRIHRAGTTQTRSHKYVVRFVSPTA
ncbi:MAG: hypothetical protein JWR35_2843 [Marmoricola sp.]|jgi:uncharacterized protein YkwD|nr:hypothetical protein [Marmoricola sp.]